MCWLSEFSELLSPPVALLAVLHLTDEAALDLFLGAPRALALGLGRLLGLRLAGLDLLQVGLQKAVLFAQLLYLKREDDVCEEKAAGLLVLVGFLDWLVGRIV